MGCGVGNITSQAKSFQLCVGYGSSERMCLCMPLPILRKTLVSQKEKVMRARRVRELLMKVITKEERLKLLRDVPT